MPLQTQVKSHKIPRWILAVIGLVVIGIMLKHPQRLTAEQAVAPEKLAANARSFQDKLGELQQAHQTGQSGVEVRISSDEVVAALAAANPPAPGVAGAQTSDSDSPLKDQQVVFEDDHVKGQFTTEVAGADVVVTFTGRVGSKDGYVTFVPAEFQIGSMPVPVAMVQNRLQKKLTDPAAREKLKLPEYVNDVKVEDGQLVLTEK
ncbi:MAG TPA: hypothetical protein VH196_05025 [Terriglobales bacterium]|jgi:hypothetical protein|nr:hypothetical protein [Terriglobales bacterium]